ncbi:YuzB family protein [Paenibacillus rhizovicinus]|uniref:YuzB family protein n=1 Tax=Paenibacillus rhizovicinus TaxID=2704463 RepID=A0A6C0NYF4_9BACL|nr:YuzB family protein [Paenibacillus rhizovicinus]QHW30743.1 YuzB family protein [Paenibacillus rhizovicinus]
MLKPMVEFCASNMHHGTDKLMKKLEGNPDYEVIEYGCLGNCGECYLAPFGMVDGQIISADTVEELETKIMDEIEEQQAVREALDRLIDDM